MFRISGQYLKQEDKIKDEIIFYLMKIKNIFQSFPKNKVDIYIMNSLN